MTDSYYPQVIEFGEKVEKRNFYAIVARVAFFMVVFFNIFGTSLPFRERILDVSEVATSNITNQIVFITMFFLALIALIPKMRVFSQFILEEKFLYIFILWCVLSMLWSEYSFIVFKRWFQLFTIVFASTVSLLYIKSDKQILKYLKPVSALFVILSFISVFTIPGALDDYGIWRGLAASKNHLGQAALVCLLVWAFAFKYATIPGKLLSFIIMILSSILLFGSKSSTAMFAFFILCGAGFLFFIDNQFKKINAGRFLSFITISSLIIFVIYAFIATPDLVSTFLGYFGEDITFTGRTDLWSDIFHEAQKHIWLGTGYQSFWVITNNDILKLYQIYIWLPKQAHNGYIDLINEVGILGSVLFLLMIISYFLNLHKIGEKQIWTWFIIAVLIVNLQESTLFHGGVLTGSIFILSYLIVIMKKFDRNNFILLSQNEDDEEPE